TTIITAGDGGGGSSALSTALPRLKVAVITPRTRASFVHAVPTSAPGRPGTDLRAMGRLRVDTVNLSVHPCPYGCRRLPHLRRGVRQPHGASVPLGTDAAGVAGCTWAQ